MTRFRIFATAIIAFCAAGIWAGTADKSAVPSPQDIKKAEYIYLEAANAEEDDRYDDYYMLLRRAARLHPDDPYIEGALAESTLALGASDSLMNERAYARLAERFETDPTDPYNYSTYVGVATHMGRIDDVISVWERLDSMMPSRTDPAMNLSNALMARYTTTLDTADFNRAVALMDRLEKALGPTPQLTAQKISAYALRKDTAAIERDLERLALSAPRDVNTILFVGRVYDAIEKPDSSLSYYDRAQKIDPYDGRVNLARAQFFHSRGDSVAYDREVFMALQSPSMEFQQKFTLLSDYVVKLYSDTAQRPRIEQMFESLQEVNPGEPDLHGLYGAYKATIGDYAGAAEQFSYSLDLDADNRDNWSNLVSVYSSLDRPDAVLASCRKALAVYPGDSYFALMGSSALASEKRYFDAVALLDSINLQSVPSERALSVIYATRGDLLYQLGERDSAFAAYAKAIDHDPENYMALNNCAYFMAESGIDLDRAELYSSIATAAEPQNPTYLDTYAWVQFKRKEYTSAREHIDSALKAYSGTDSDENGDAATPAAEPSSDVYEHAGDIYFMTGDHRQALEFWKKALEDDPDNALLKKKVQHKTMFFE